LTDDGSLPERSVEEPLGEFLERARDIERALAELPPHYRDAIELTKLNGLSGTEAAEALKTTRSAVKLRVHRGYQLLRRLLDGADDVVPDPRSAAAIATAA
jgi:RNA polymerase sigma-70 factor (ECF subfamily)